MVSERRTGRLFSVGNGPKVNPVLRGDSLYPETKNM